MSTLTVPPIIVTKAYGSSLKLEYLVFEAIAKRVEAVWQTFDGAEFTGKRFSILVTDEGTTYTYTDGTQEKFAAPVFSATAVQNIIDQTKLNTVGQAKVK